MLAGGSCQTEEEVRGKGEETEPQWGPLRRDPTIDKGHKHGPQTRDPTINKGPNHEALINQVLEVPSASVAL